MLRHFRVFALSWLFRMSLHRPDPLEMASGPFQFSVLKRFPILYLRSLLVVVVFLITVLIIKGVRERTLSVGKSRARNPTQNPTQKPTPNRPEPGRTIQRLRTAPCPQALRSARDAWRAHGPSSEETVLISEIKKEKSKPQTLKLSQS